MVSPPVPAISVIIPTYNWSAALACAIRSVLLQTMQDFEILVVGDGCTDDSEQVVRGFGDTRISWHNLERNYGSQWAANNFGLEAARSNFVAYLGHDDIWYPTHLEAILRAADENKAAMVTSVMAIYGPTGSHVRGIAGLFATGAYTPRDFVPPSAFAHARSLYGPDMHWQSPDKSELPLDVVFINDMIARSGRPPASTGELTCFKFNAAWRRNSYKTRNVDDQQDMLARVQSGVDFRQAELLGIIQAATADRFIKFTVPTGKHAKGAIAERNRIQRGLESRFAEADLVTIASPVRFDMRDQAMSFEWHEFENAHGRTFRWTGPSPSATIDLPVRFDRDLKVVIGVLQTLHPLNIETIAISIENRTVAHRLTKSDAGAFEIELDLRHDLIAPSARDLAVTITVAEMVRPCDVSDSTDTRTLGVAVGWIEIRPLDA